MGQFTKNDRKRLFCGPSYLRFFMTAALVFLITGCTSTGTIDSNKSDSYNGKVKRLFIVGKLGDTLSIGFGNEYASFSTTMTSTLIFCGTQSQYFVQDPLSFDQIMNQNIRAFKPDSILYIRWDTYGGYGIGTYFLQLIDTTTMTPVWKATINFQGKAGDAGVALAAIIIGRMKQDGLIDASCAVPHPVEPN